jgi:hypothetical protein
MTKTMRTYTWAQTGTVISAAGQLSYDIEHSSLSINVARLGSSVTTVSVTESSSWPVSIDSWPLLAIARIR